MRRGPFHVICAFSMLGLGQVPVCLLFRLDSSRVSRMITLSTSLRDIIRETSHLPCWKTAFRMLLSGNKEQDTAFRLPKCPVSCYGEVEQQLTFVCVYFCTRLKTLQPWLVWRPHPGQGTMFLWSCHFLSGNWAQRPQTSLTVGQATEGVCPSLSHWSFLL